MIKSFYKQLVWLLLASSVFATESGQNENDYEGSADQNIEQQLDQLPIAEKVRRFGVIVDRMDRNNDQLVSAKELQQWLVYLKTREAREEAAQRLEKFDTNKDKKISWKEYKEVAFGNLEEEGSTDGQYQTGMAKDKRKFYAADQNRDQSLEVEEFAAFIRPHEYEHMEWLLAKEVLKDMDENKDGFVDEEEFIKNSHKKQGLKQNGGRISPWILQEKKQFSERCDKNKDGKIDEREMRNWLVPAGFDHHASESEHILSGTDNNKDGKLSKAEFFSHLNLFLETRVTDYGEALLRHDEF